MNPLNMKDSVMLLQEIVVTLEDYGEFLNKDEITFTLLQVLFAMTAEELPDNGKSEFPGFKKIDKFFINHLSKHDKDITLSAIATWFCNYYLGNIFDGYEVSEEDFNNFHKEPLVNDRVIPFPVDRIRGEN